MRALHLTIAAAAAGLLLAAGTNASAAPLAPASPAPMGVDLFDGAVEPVHYRRRAVRNYHYPYYRSGPVINFGYSPYAYASPYYARPYGYGYRPYGYGGYPYGGYGYGPSFGFGLRLN
jgi:hypothetical protein